MTHTVVTMNTTPALTLPLPRLDEGCFGACSCFTDEALLEACGVRIAFTERSGGVSAGPFDSLNLGRNVNDDASCVARNRSLLLKSLGVEGASVIQPQQVHGTDILLCRTADDAHALSTCENKADAVIVDYPEVAALLCFADCVPIIVVAPSGAFSVVHAGWRGVMGRIVESAIIGLCRLSGFSPSSFNLYMGPYIHACHFEVEVELRGDFEREFGKGCVLDDRHVDLGVALRESMRRVGVADERIADVGVCTVCDAGERFYSYRLSDGVCGRHGAFAVKLACDG